MSEGKNVISQHLFLFPFVIAPIRLGKKFDREFISKLLANDKWKPKEFDCQLNYSEFVYFHRYVRETAFTGNKESSLFDYYLKKCEEGSTLELSMADGISYKLALDYLSLHVFETGIGILSLELKNTTTAEFSDILRINDLLRRIYPSFLDSNGTTASQKNDKILPDKIILHLSDGKVEEDFSAPFINTTNQIKIARHISMLLGESFLDCFYAEPVIDDRMYTLCWYANNDLSDYMKNIVSGKYAYEDSEDWYKFVFVDSGIESCCKNRKMRQELIRTSTYARWIECGTLFGISRYSFVALTGSSDFSYNVVRNHMHRQYYQMVIFLLAQRASAINFANQIASISKLIDQLDIKKGDVKIIADEVRTLHGKFIGFVNRMWFEEVTPQEQGIELFDIAQRQMKLKDQISELKEEMKELFEFVELHHQKEQNLAVYRLTILAGLGLPITILVGFWGMNFKFTTEQDFLWFIISGVLTLIVLLVIWKSFRRK